MESVLLEKNGAVGRLILNRPEKRNALSLDVMNEVIAKLDLAAQDEEMKILIVTGNGPVFSAGHDLSEVLENHEESDALRTIFNTCSRMMLRLHRLPQPVIAQVRGVATAAGCQMVAACDLAIAETGARFATPGVKIGLFCSTPMIPLIRVIGRRRAMEMLLSGRFISAEEAERFGLINRIVPPDRLDEETMQWAEELAQFSRYTLSLGKRAFYTQAELAEETAYDYAGEIMAANAMAQDAREGMSAFLEKRSPVWKNR